jgi:hypothetical protein
MNCLTVLDIVIGLVFIYLLYSLLSTIIQEFLATALRFRAKLLERAVFRMLEDGKLFDRRFSSIKALFQKGKSLGKSCELVSLFYQHPSIKYLSEGKGNDKPSYIGKENFSRVLLDMLHGDQIKPGDDIKPLIDKTLTDGVLPGTTIHIGPKTLKQLRLLWFESQAEVTQFRIRIEQWFDTTMERCTGWYKAKTQYILFAIGLIIAVTFDVDTISIAGKLCKDNTTRDAIVQQADMFIKDYPKLYDNVLKGAKPNDTIKNNRKDSDIVLIKRGFLLIHTADSLMKTDLAKTNGLLGLGWDKASFAKHKTSLSKAWHTNFGSFLLQLLLELWHGFIKLIGWIVTALAISLGAPFWFDQLNRLMKLRTSIRIPVGSESSAKKK